MNVRECVAINHLDFCSGIGGWALAFRELGINTVAFCEIEKYPQKVLQKNFPGVPIFNDLKELTYEDIKERTGVDGIDILTCSYPCQPFSVAGKQKGEEDPRHLWPDTFRLVQECRPTWFVGENVSGHIKLGLDTVLEDLASEGYDTRTFVIPASSVGAWHKRERLWIIGYSEHNGSLTTKKSRKHQETARGAPQGQNQTEQSEGASRPRNHENVPNTSGKRSPTQREREHRELEKESQGKEKTRGESTVRTPSSCTDVSDTNNSGNRTSRHEADREQPQTDQGWQEQSQLEFGGHSENVSDTESLRFGRGSGEECRTPQWQFLQEEQEGREVWREAERCGTSLDESTDASSVGLEEHGHSESKDVVQHREETISDTECERSQRWLPRWQNQERESELGHAGCGSTAHLQQGENWWKTQSELCGVPNGISVELDKNRVGRIKGLGNAIVPQIAWFIGNAIITAEKKS